MQRTSRSPVPLALLALSAPVVAQNLIRNGSFESPVVPPGENDVTPTEWTWESVSGFVFHCPSGCDVWPAAGDADQYVDIGNLSSIALSQAFDVTEPCTYRLSWLDNTAGSSDPDSDSFYSVTVTDSSLDVVASEVFDARHGGGWGARTMSMALTPDTYVLTLRASDDPHGFDSLIDQMILAAALGDLDCNCTVDLTDLATLLAHFGTPSGATRSDGDLDGNGAVDLSDLAILLANFGLICP